jgi:acyl-CoA thioesterase I
MTRLFLLLFSLLAMSCSHAEQHSVVPAGETVLVLGDSISYGNGANVGEDYPTLLAAKTGWNIINAGVPGDTTEMGLARLPELLEDNSLKLVLVELGGNDFLHHIPRAQTTANLQKILAMIKVKQIPAVILAIPKASLFGAAVGNLSDDPMFEELGKENDTAVIADDLANVLSQNELKADPIHPNALGYQKLAEAIEKSLKVQGFLE